MPQRCVDVAIVGAGPAGAAAGTVLAASGMRVCMLDRLATRSFRVGEGLPPSARPLLRELGVLDAVLADGHRPSPGTLAFWGDDQPHAQDVLRQLHGHGWQLDRIRFDAALRAAAASAGADLLDARVEVAGLQRAGIGFELLARDRDGSVMCLRARWLIDASGRAAQCARALGAARIEHDRLFGFHQRLRGGTATDHDARTWVEAVEDGWWYSVLLPAGERLVVFLGDVDRGDRCGLLVGDQLWRKLADTRHLSGLCSRHGWRPAGVVRGAPAGSTELDRAAGAGWLAVGDAATAFDPLSSKGITNALYTGLRAAAAIGASERGDANAARDYALHVREVHAAYRAQLRAFYAMEQRWSDRTFWQARHRGSNPGPARDYC